MAQIKYKQPSIINDFNQINYEQFICNTQNQQYMIATQPISRTRKSKPEVIEEKKGLRGSQVLISVYNQNPRDDSQQQLKHTTYQKVKIQRGISFQEKIANSSRKIQQKMQYQLTKSTYFRKNSFGVFQLPKGQRYYQSNSPRKDIKNNSTQSKGNLFQKIIDFRTKSLKLRHKIVDSAFKHYCQHPNNYQKGSVSQKMSNLRSLVDQNYEQNIFEVDQFNYLNAMIAKSKDSKKQNINMINHILQRQRWEGEQPCVKQYSSNEIYTKIRKQYKKEESDDIFKIQSTKNNQNTTYSTEQSNISSKFARQTDKNPKKRCLRSKRQRIVKKDRILSPNKRFKGGEMYLRSKIALETIYI